MIVATRAVADNIDESQGNQVFEFLTQEWRWSRVSSALSAKHYEIAENLREWRRSGRAVEDTCQSLYSIRSYVMGKGNNAQKKETKKAPKDKAVKAKPATTSLDKTKK